MANDPCLTTWPIATDSAARILSVRRLSDHDLAAKLDELNAQKRTLDAELILYLSELERRRLYREHACASLFEFCVARLGCSEDVAYKRVGAARMPLQFPVIFELLAKGRVHLTGLMLLKPHLTPSNHEEWLWAACDKSKRQIEKLIATRLPCPDVPTSVRKLPVAKATAQANVSPPNVTQSATASFGVQPDTAQPHASMPDASMPDASMPGAPIPGASQSGSSQFGAVPGTLQSDASMPGTSQQSSSSLELNVLSAVQVVPLSSRSYRVVFTASERMKQKIERARELLSHVIPSADLPAIIERALDQLIQREEQRRYAVHTKTTGSHRAANTRPVESQDPDPTHRAAASAPEAPEPQTPEQHLHSPCQNHSPSPGESQDPDPRSRMGVRQRSRHVPAAVRRAVFTRDGGQCTFVDPSGRRCEQRLFLEFDHGEAFAVGGPTTVDNLRLRCRAHNAREAEKLFGQKRIAGAIANARRGRAR